MNQYMIVTLRINREVRDLDQRHEALMAQAAWLQGYRRGHPELGITRDEGDVANVDEALEECGWLLMGLEAQRAEEARCD